MAFPVFEKKEDIPKGFEDDYEEKEGKFHPKVPDVKARRRRSRRNASGRTTRRKARVEGRERVAEETEGSGTRRQHLRRAVERNFARKMQRNERPSLILFSPNW
jgi:hypothetical protein